MLGIYLKTVTDRILGQVYGQTADYEPRESIVNGLVLGGERNAKMDLQ